MQVNDKRYSMQRGKFTANSFENQPRGYAFKANAVGIKKNAGLSDVGGSGTPAKQKKIYEVWPGKLPARFASSQNIPVRKNMDDSMAYGEDLVRNGHVSHGKERGSSGCVFFQPLLSTMPEMYLPQRPAYHSDNWLNPNGISYAPPISEGNGSIYGYQGSSNMYSDYPAPPFRDGLAPPLSMYSYHALQQDSCKRTINIRAVESTRKENPKKASQSSSTKPSQVPDPPLKNDVDISGHKSKEKPKSQKIFVATNVRGLQAWSEVEKEMVVIFEIIGVLNSQITTMGSGRCKSFLLKDGQNHTVTCNFFETDRQLGRMCRGKTYRCVGDFNVRGRFFHAFSVREADEKALRLYRKLVAVANGALKRYKDS